jgi:3-oxoadipate enol-lactonase
MLEALMARVDVTNGSLHVLDEGAGPPVLFIHGFPLDHRLWLDQVRTLRSSHRCLAPDLLGSGRSDPVAERELTMESLAADMAAVVEWADAGPVDVVALSMGGYVALAMWEATPSLFRSLTLADTKATADGEEARAAREATIQRLVTDGRAALAADMAKGLLGEAPSPDAIARLKTMIEDTPYETIVAALRGMRDRADRTVALDAITVPTLVVGGAEDQLMPEVDMRSLGDAIPGARTVIIPGAGHLPPIEQPEAMTGALEEFFAEL